MNWNIHIVHIPDNDRSILREHWLCGWPHKRPSLRLLDYCAKFGSSASQAVSVPGEKKFDHSCPQKNFPSSQWFIMPNLSIDWRVKSSGNPPRGWDVVENLTDLSKSKTLLAWKFHWYPFLTFRVIQLTDGRTDRQADRKHCVTSSVVGDGKTL